MPCANARESFARAQFLRGLDGYRRNIAHPRAGTSFAVGVSRELLLRRRDRASRWSSFTSGTGPHHLHYAASPEGRRRCDTRRHRSGRRCGHWRSADAARHSPGHRDFARLQPGGNRPCGRGATEPASCGSVDAAQLDFSGQAGAAGADLRTKRTRQAMSIIFLILPSPCYFR
jgi:hypothetical protein